MKAGIYGRFISFSRCATVVAMLAGGLFRPVHSRADGCFVAPPFVWNKHKDINEPTQKAVIIYDAGREDLILQVKYDGPVEQFGWLVPVPARPVVQNGLMECFYELSRYTQEHWEPRQYTLPAGMDAANFLRVMQGSGIGPKPDPVKVVEVKTAGAYKVAVLSATEPGALEKWLAANGFAFPRDKADVIDDYVRRHWYFVAARIDLGREDGFKTMTAPRQGGGERRREKVAEKLSTGELNPLRLTFASQQCVFPLKISAMNGSPSEVQVYVLSPQPLVERRMFEKKFAEVKQLALEQINRRPATDYDAIFMGGLPSGWAMHYAAVAAGEFPECARMAPGFRTKPWWLTKQTWTFKPEEMEDLIFEPAAPVFAQTMADDAGAYGAALLEIFGTDAIPEVLSALQSPDVQTRVHTMRLLAGPVAQDARVAALMPALFRDSDRRVRGAAAFTAEWNWRPEYAGPLFDLLRDEDPGVRATATQALQFRGQGRVSSVLDKMMASSDLKKRVLALAVIGPDGPVQVTNLLPMLAADDGEAVQAAVSFIWRGRYMVTDSELAALMHNKYWKARRSAVDLLFRQDQRESAGKIIPLLNDTNLMVRDQAWGFLKKATGQQIPEDKPAQWQDWWTANANSVLMAELNNWLYSYPRNGRLHHRRGCAYYNAGDFPKALADFQQACALTPDIADYAHFRIWILQARQGERFAATWELRKYLNARAAGKRGDWPATVGNFLIGRMSEADFIAAAQNANSQTDREQHCEAWFYTGVKRVMAGDKAMAAEDFKKCLATGVDSFEEYDSAAAELKWLGVQGRL